LVVGYTTPIGTVSKKYATYKRYAKVIKKIGTMNFHGPTFRNHLFNKGNNRYNCKISGINQYTPLNLCSIAVSKNRKGTQINFTISTPSNKNGPAKFGNKIFLIKIIPIPARIEI